MPPLVIVHNYSYHFSSKKEREFSGLQPFTTFRVVKLFEIPYITPGLEGLLKEKNHLWVLTWEPSANPPVAQSTIHSISRMNVYTERVRCGIKKRNT